MNILVVNSNLSELKDIVSKIKETGLARQVDTCMEPKEVMMRIEAQKSDIIFIETHLKNISGIALAKTIRKVFPSANIFFISASSAYAADAFSIHAAGYLVKPVKTTDIANELSWLKNNVMGNTLHPSVPILRVQTFGTFSVFYEGRLLCFKRRKAKELFAYLIDRRGSDASMQEIAAVLWEDREYNHSLLVSIHAMISEITRVLKSVGAEDVLIRMHNGVAINPLRISCDYYDFLNGDVIAERTWTGEYMANYTWAEYKIENIQAEFLKRLKLTDTKVLQSRESES